MKLVVFDLAGTTLYDGEGIVVDKLQEALNEGGFVLDRAAINATMGTPKRLAISDLTGADDDAVDAIHQDFRRRMIAFYREDPSVREIEGVSKMFAVLRATGVRIAVDTGFDRETTNALLSRLPWDGLVDYSVTSDEVEKGRPHPDMVYKLMEAAGIDDAGQVAKVGDTPSDLNEGAAAKCKLNIGVCYGSHTEDQLRPFPHTHLVASVGELEGILLGG